MSLYESEELPFDKRFARYNEPGGPGLAVMAIQDDATRFKKGYGLSNLVTKEPVDCDTNFRMASVSKQFTAMAVAILEEQGLLSRDDYIGVYLDDLPEYMQPIRVRHLVHHLSGLPDYADALWSTDKSKPLITHHDVYKYYQQQNQLDFAVGQQHEYSNGGYSLLALVVERAAGKSLRDFSQEQIFRPAGMNTTDIIQYPTQIHKQAISYGDWPFFEDIDFNTGNALHGEDGVYTSINDMEKWIRALDNHLLVDAATTEKIFAKVETNTGKPVDYGYGWQWEKYKGDIDLVGHTGSWVGFHTFIVKAPERKTWFVAFSNSTAIDAEDAVFHMADYYFNVDSSV